MGSTVIINRTSTPLEMKMGNHRSFTEVATVAKNGSYTVKVDSNHTYQEYRLEAAVHNTDLNSVILNSDECVDNKTIIIKEVEGKLHVEREPREMPRLSSNSTTSASILHDQLNLNKNSRTWFFQWW